MNGSPARAAAPDDRIPFSVFRELRARIRTEDELDARVGRSIGGVADARYERVDLTLLYLINYSAR